MIFKTVDNDTKMVMFERTMMPESNMVKKDGKTSFEKTGRETEMTTYTFRNGFGEKLIVLSKDNSYRDLEGALVELELEVVYNDFQKRNRISLAKVTKVA